MTRKPNRTADAARQRARTARLKADGAQRLPCSYIPPAGREALVRAMADGWAAADAIAEALVCRFPPIGGQK